MANKGGQYERDICRTLSLWMTNGRDDDQMWRSSQSGGRATTRAKKGKKTKGHSGDTIATGRFGKRLLSVVTLEIKRGYNTDANLHSVIDRTGTNGIQMYEEWFLQTKRAADRAGTPYWWLIHRRDKFTATLYMPYKMWVRIPIVLEKGISPFAHLQFQVRDGTRDRHKTRTFNVVALQLDQFLELVPPSCVFDLGAKK